MADLLMKQVQAVIDSRTTAICLHAAGQIRKVEEPFETLLGPQETTPFHVHCRSMEIPWMPGFVNDLRRDANAELMRRPKKERRLGPGGEIGAKLPPKVAPTEPVPLPTTPVFGKVALPKPGALKVLNIEKHQVMSPVQMIADPEARAIGFWQESFAATKAVRQVIRNAEAGIDVWTDVDLDARWFQGWRSAKVWEDFSTAYDVDDLKNEILHAATFLQDRIDAAGVAPTLFRGMRVEAAEDVFSPGLVLDADMTSWSTSEDFARTFTAHRPESGTTETGTPVMMIGRGLKAFDLDADGKVQPQYKNMAEHLTRLPVRVVSVERRDGILWVEVDGG